MYNSLLLGVQHLLVLGWETYKMGPLGWFDLSTQASRVRALHWAAFRGRIGYQCDILSLVTRFDWKFFHLARWLQCCGREQASPRTDGAGRVKLSCVMPASDILIWLIHISWRMVLHLCVSTINVFWQYGTFCWVQSFCLSQGRYIWKRDVVVSLFHVCFILHFNFL